MSQKKKIMVLIPTGTGHVNPICGLIHELCKNKNLEVLFYSDEAFRGLIENTGATFRLNEAPTFSTIDPNKMASNLSFGSFIDMLINFAYAQLPQYIAEVEKEKPDLILYEGMSYTARYLIEIIKARHAKGDKTIPVPKTAAFEPHFPITEKLIKLMRANSKESILSLFSIANVFRKQFVLSLNYGISVYNPLRFLQESDPNINIFGLNPELEPDHDKFDHTFKFVGSCISEEARSVDIDHDPQLNSLLTQFDNKPNDLKLIFMSLGTVFNAKFYVVEKAIEAFMKFDEHRNRHFKSSQLKIIISVGGPGLKNFNEKISQGKLNLPNNILLRAKVPQLEVLKRADLFITHCGMNSTLETIKYGVPVIGMPLSADQPLVAIRICDELKYGIRLDPDNFTINQLNDSIDQVLSDGKFKANIDRMSKISAKYNGAVEGAKLLTDYLYQ
jgi:MGT family glycosyltransferase